MPRGRRKPVEFTSATFSSLEGMEGLRSEEQTIQMASASRWHTLKTLYPGALVTIVAAGSAASLSSIYETPVMLLALLLGMALGFLNEVDRCAAGIGFCSRTVLRMGVAILGLRITWEQIVSYGPLPIAVVLLGVATTILFGLLAARRLGFEPSLGLLTGGAVAICGASAALAIASVLPDKGEMRMRTVFTVLIVTLFSTFAMITYPVLATLGGFTDTQAGFFFGGSIHDVAQVVGAGLMVSPQAGDAAIFVKLLRVSMLLPVVALVAFYYRAGRDKAVGKVPLLPGFLVVFALLAAIRSVGIVPPYLVTTASSVSSALLTVAITALGMQAPFGKIVAMGWRPVLLILAETAWLGGLVFAMVFMLA